MKAIVNGKVYFGSGFKDGMVLVYDEKIQDLKKIDEVDLSVYDEIIDAAGAYVVPAFIDVHIHGYNGVDTMDGDSECVKIISKGITSNGVGAFLPTTMTMDKPSIEKALKNVRKTKDEQEGGATILGVHLEGPFISAKYKGAQPEEYIVKPDFELMEEYKDIIKVVTIAPETEGALEMIDKYSDTICFSLGHSSADAYQAKDGFAAGAKSVTHLFNAMTGVHHRNVGLATAALVGDNYVELIADNKHVNPILFPLVKKAKGIDKVLLITDCMMAGGLKEGVYSLGGQKVTVKDGICRLDDGTIAGSILKLKDGLKNFIKANDSTLEECITAVTLNQAKYLGVEDDYGTLDIGKYSNITLLNKDLDVVKTIVKGVVEYEI